MVLSCCGKVLVRHLGFLRGGLVVEVGSGSGQHVAHFAKLLPALTFQPTEYPGHPSPLAAPQDEEKILRSIGSYTSGLPNCRAGVALDATALVASDLCPDGSAAAVVAINVAHISPPVVLEGLVAGAGRKLAPGVGCLVLYGPWAVEGRVEGAGNQRFDAMLRRLDPSFGLRDTAELRRLAQVHGLQLVDMVHFPQSNNYALVLRKRKGAAATAT